MPNKFWSVAFCSIHPDSNKCFFFNSESKNVSTVWRQKNQGNLSQKKKKKSLESWTMVKQSASNLIDLFTAAQNTTMKEKKEKSFSFKFVVDGLNGNFSRGAEKLSTLKVSIWNVVNNTKMKERNLQKGVS